MVHVFVQTSYTRMGGVRRPNVANDSTHVVYVLIVVHAILSKYARGPGSGDLDPGTDILRCFKLQTLTNVSPHVLQENVCSGQKVP